MVVTSSIYKRDVRNKYFRKIWDSYLRRDLRVPPENTQSIILTAGIHIQDGDWKSCIEKLKILKVWSEIRHSKYIYKKVYNKSKLECMKCYLFKYGSVYVSISFNKLAKMFNLSISQCKQYICTMITSSKDQKFKASIDEISNCIVVHQTPPTPLQRIALEYSTKLSYFIEQNEKILNISKNQGYNQGNLDDEKQGTKNINNKDNNNSNKYKKQNKLRNKILPITNTMNTNNKNNNNNTLNNSNINKNNINNNSQSKRTWRDMTKKTK